MKLIAIDLDGTLLTNEGKISENNRKAIHKAQNQGDIVTIASGRSLHDTIQILAEAKLECPIIAGNGAIIYESGTILQNHFLPANIVKEMIEKIEAIGLYYELYTNKGVFTSDNGKALLTTEAQRLHDQYDDFPREKATHMIDMQFTQKGLVYVKSYHDLDYAALEVYKVFVLSFDQKRLSELDSLLKERSDISLTTSANEKLEIGHPLTSKGNALEFFAKHLEVPLENIVAIGDNLNDLSMFDIAGFRIAMGNAEDVVKEKADFVTKAYDEDGVAYGLQQLYVK
ncbi:Cof-type HAD-IIB family hydrolase [Oceanobacillus bengalensis]|uniref:HAD family phosphatase n=1 Tax=Oceanobacillus bengalensis TaxID=1435466 RepID=A0A494YXP4_9BACI|nr:Cof-type HAD-IIB family hydrolase [Oceanobacillus bengalensis]RKQ14785.1 HAD family phosphatase [Oceanobacillus bengalensis]